MVPAIVCFLMLAVELWWAAAFSYAYQQLKQHRLLLQVLQGLLLGTFFLLLGLNSLSDQLTTLSLAQMALVVAAVVVAALWRTSGGPELLRERYTNRLTDVLRFRRPAVDMRRRVRGR